jgi:hypothetical protein
LKGRIIPAASIKIIEIFFLHNFFLTKRFLTLALLIITALSEDWVVVFIVEIEGRHLRNPMVKA